MINRRLTPSTRGTLNPHRYRAACYESKQDRCCNYYGMDSVAAVTPDCELMGAPPTTTRQSNNTCAQNELLRQLFLLSASGVSVTKCHDLLAVFWFHD